ncbi:unnamed protein product [Musa acuminata subsp. malaccensis]|uniref:(wild Malaysian banana) hypothetical protein n=1 Tax=Musa acuminata subsp. malaccensis TaxID=214687 RepID=A0A804L5E9_MUSAM|nr:unnamed protein product [Musa acuminata subsp. malaccensis]
MKVRDVPSYVKSAATLSTSNSTPLADITDRRRRPPPPIRPGLKSFSMEDQQ